MRTYTEFRIYIHKKRTEMGSLSTSVEQKTKNKKKKNGRKKSTVWRETGDSIVRVYNKYYSVWRAVVNYTI
jgi:hypothetical protein